MRSSQPVNARPPISRRCDLNGNHPFMFFLRDDRKGALLFAGRLMTP